MWGDLLRQVFGLPLLLLKKAVENPMGVFIYGILSKWYVMVMISVIVVTFWVLKGLEKSGVLEAMHKEVHKGLITAQAVAQNCTPLITDLPKMWECIERTTAADYVPTDHEVKLRQSLQSEDSNNTENNLTPHNPYE